MRWSVVFLALIAFLLGCATGSSVVTGNVRSPIDPALVKVYLDPPPEYETIGLVEASSDVELSSQAAQDRVIAELRRQAARLGANGVILGGISTQTGGSSGYYSGGVYYTVDSEKKVAAGRAIYVDRDAP